jgi:hypothetical protein
MRVSHWDKVLRRVLDGKSDHNIGFDDLRGLLLRLGFDERINGDHHVFGKDGIREIIDLQPQSDGKAKGYQVRQVRDILQKYGLTRVP